MDRLRGLRALLRHPLDPDLHRAVPRQSPAGAREGAGARKGAGRSRVFEGSPLHRLAFAAMFERTALPDGPRVIIVAPPRSALCLHRRLRPGRLAPRIGRGSRARRTSWSTSPSRGPPRIPTTRAVSEAIEGVGGSFNAATDRESTVYWVRVPLREMTRGMDVLGELIVRPHLRARRSSRSGRSSSRRSAPTSTIRASTSTPSSTWPCSATRRSAARSPAAWRASGPCRQENLRAFWASAYRPGNVVVSAAGDISHAEVVALVERAFGTGDANRLELRAGAAAPGRRAGDGGAARHDSGADSA